LESVNGSIYSRRFSHDARMAASTKIFDLKDGHSH